MELVSPLPILRKSVIANNGAPDVLKALCLGARAVGLGRPFLYAQSVRARAYRLLVNSNPEIGIRRGWSC